MSERHTMHVALQQTGPIPLDLALTCAPGELLAIVGASGAGKTTALRAIAGLYSVRSGRISCGDEVWFDAATHVALPPQARRVGLVFQSYALFPHLTALHNVTAAMSHIPPEQRESRARQILADVHLAGFDERKPGTMSGGQQQRVALARALAREPHVLLLDEPFSAVDRRTRRKLREELGAVRRTLNSPSILVTHDLDDAVALADRMIVLDRGAVIQEGTPADILAHPASQLVRDALDIGE